LKEFSTYRPEDVTILLKDITGQVTPLGTKEREKKIQSGVHYCEMLPLEYEPSEKYLQEYYLALGQFKRQTAMAVAVVSEKILEKKGEGAVLVSLARAGTPVGILIKHYLEKSCGVKVYHYTISIIRGRGIDKNAMKYILDRHPAGKLVFVDGWTGKGAIKRQLDEALKDYPEVKPDLAVLADPGFVADMCGTHDDFIIASSCLNSTVSGLLSRTFLRSDIIGPEDFHGAAYYSELRDKDLTYQFIDEVEGSFPDAESVKKVMEKEHEPAGKACHESASNAGEDTAECNEDADKIMSNQQNGTEGAKGLVRTGMEEVLEIKERFGINDINFIKPGIGETTRVLLRRVPWKVLVNSLDDEEYLGHIYQLAREKGVEVEQYPLTNYRACGIIKDLADA
jgi:hypothetical protein